MHFSMWCSRRIHRERKTALNTEQNRAAEKNETLCPYNSYRRIFYASEKKKNWKTSWPVRLCEIHRSTTHTMVRFYFLNSPFSSGDCVLRCSLVFYQHQLNSLANFIRWLTILTMIKIIISDYSTFATHTIRSALETQSHINFNLNK